MPYRVPELPYSFDALEPYIDAETMELHHDKHHAAYVDGLNKTLADYPELQNRPVDALIAKLEAIPDAIRTAVRNHGGGHYNHSLFWGMMKRDGGGTPRGELADLIKEKFGSFVEFKYKLTQAALGQFGSGCAWLCYREGSLEVTATANQDSPLMRDGGEPILGVDVWEHAYYLHYKNRRSEYLEAWWNVVNWEHASDNLQAAKKVGRVFGFPVASLQPGKVSSNL